VPYFDGHTPRVLAHRGFADGHAENTIGAFRAALDVGADILETDVHLSKDGQVIVAHDADLSRVAGLPGLVSDYTASELAGIDVGFGEGFPTLVEALEAFPGAKFNIDLKAPEVIDPFVDVVSQMNAHDRLLVASFDEASRSRAVSKLPGVVSSATSGHIIEGRLRSWLGLSGATWTMPPEIRALQVPPAHWGMALVTPSLVRMAHQKGLEVHVWTINDARDMERLLEMGVDGIVTDRADIAVEIVAKRRALL
jgi:glycerophosphoryl diester phosphodiesterase